MKKTLLMAVMAMMVAGSCMASSHEANVADAQAKMARWEEMSERQDFFTPVVESNKLYYHGDMRMSYYDEWVVHEKKDQQNLDRFGVVSVGLPEKWAEEQAKKGNADHDI